MRTSATASRTGLLPLARRARPEHRSGAPVPANGARRGLGGALRSLLTAARARASRLWARGGVASHTTSTSDGISGPEGGGIVATANSAAGCVPSSQAKRWHSLALSALALASFSRLGSARSATSRLTTPGSLGNPPLIVTNISASPVARGVSTRARVTPSSGATGAGEACLAETRSCGSRYFFA